MAKDLRRKARRRAHRPTPIDDGLAQLASVLAEYQLDSNAYGWFRMPWRDGENAIGLCRSTSVRFLSDERSPDDIDEILRLLNATKRDSVIYEQAGRLYRGLIQPKINTHTSRLLAAALRCLQLKIANSHGGGHAYNEVLIPAFLPVEPAIAERHVLIHRCLDAIGVHPDPQGEAIDRKRVAFVTAWKRGLYIAAYSIPPVV